MNRPYGAVDVSANLKGAVPKTATQKILLALAEKGELVQKTYGRDCSLVLALKNLMFFCRKDEFFCVQPRENRMYAV
jgi:26S proteasome regulatory subunit, ATPase 3, interacting protein